MCAFDIESMMWEFRQDAFYLCRKGFTEDFDESAMKVGVTLQNDNTMDKGNAIHYKNPTNYRLTNWSVMVQSTDMINRRYFVGNYL